MQLEEYPDDVYCEPCGDSIRSHALDSKGCIGAGCEDGSEEKRCRMKPEDLNYVPTTTRVIETQEATITITEGMKGTKVVVQPKPKHIWASSHGMNATDPHQVTITKKW